MNTETNQGDLIDNPVDAEIQSCLSIEKPTSFFLF